MSKMAFRKTLGIPHLLRVLRQGFEEIPESRTGCKTPLACLLYTSPSPRDGLLSRMPSSA